jgi:small subunit ribosomal protein S4
MDAVRPSDVAYSPRRKPARNYEFEEIRHWPGIVIQYANCAATKAPSRGYGVLERQFARYFDAATRQKAVPTGLRLLQLLEVRLDNIVHRSGLVPSRAQARQLILHGHITVNGKSVRTPSFQLKVGEVVSTAEKSKALVRKLIADNPSAGAPRWVNADLENLKVSVQQLPSREDLDQTIKEALIVEFYSR